MGQKMTLGGNLSFSVTKKHLGMLQSLCVIYIFIFIYAFIICLRSEECGRQFAYRTDGTRYQPCHTQSLKRSGRKSVPVWGWFSSEGAGAIQRIEGRFTSEKYIQILEDVLLPTAWARFGLGPIRFVQDRSPIHTSHAVTDWFADHPEFELIPWPSKGADLNPIENVWSEMVRDMNSQHVRNSDELWDDVLNIWNNLVPRRSYFRTLVNSMPSRLQMVIDLGGEWTKY